MNLKDACAVASPEPSERGPALTCSQIGWVEDCERRGAYLFHGVIGMPPPPLTRRKFAMGWVFEDHAFRWLEREGIRVRDRQRRVVWEGITGSIDGIVDEPDGPVLIDVKSMSGYGYKKFAGAPAKGKWKAIEKEGLDGTFTKHYRTQCSAYALATGCRRFAVIGISRDSLEMDVEYEDVDEEWLRAAILEPIKRIRLSRHPEEFERGLSSPNATECEYCDYQVRCWGA